MCNILLFFKCTLVQVFELFNVDVNALYDMQN